MQELAAILRTCAPDAYYVGGVVRNSLLKKFSTDVDLALPAERVKPVARALAKKLKAAAFEMDAEFGVWRLVTRSGQVQIDLTAFQGKDLKADLLRRDFTINAMAYPVTAPITLEIQTAPGQKAQILLKRMQKKHLVDLRKGLKDLAAKRVALNTPHAFVDDPLRMLRAFRQAAELKFSIAPALLRQLQKDTPRILQSAGERVQEELTRLFATPRAYEHVLLMEKTGLLEEIFPELIKQRTCAQCYYGEGGVLKHTLLCLKREEWLLEHLSKAFPKHYKKLDPFINKSLLKMAVLLHDVAKPYTARRKKGRLRFFFHEQKGALMAQAILERLHYSKADIRLVCAMIGAHLRPSNLACNDVITDRGAYKFFRDLDHAAIPMLLLCWADYTSYISDAAFRRVLPKSTQRMMTLRQAEAMPEIGKTLRHMQLVNLLFKKYFEHPTQIHPIRLIDGRDVMQVLQLPPSKRVGEILEAVALAQVEGKVIDKESALEFVRTHYAADAKAQ